MKTIEERIKEIKHCGECAIYCMDNHKVHYLTDDGSFNDVINSMHNAKNKDELSEAYYKYINLCIVHGYSDGETIAGIMQNEAKNKEFNVNIDSVIKSLIEIKYAEVKLSESAQQEKPVVKPAEKNGTTSNHAESVKENMGSILKTVKGMIKPTIQPVEEVYKPVEEADKPAGGAAISNKTIGRIKGRLGYISKLGNKVLSNKSDNIDNDINTIRSTAKEIKLIIAAIDPTTCTEQEIADLNDISAVVDNLLKSIENIGTAVKNVSNQQVVVAQSNSQAQQAEAASNVSGFNIANFIKEDKPADGPIAPESKPQQKQTAFPHQICGLTDDQIIEEVGKHFKLLGLIPIHAYPLYDLANNKLLARKMKQLDAKQRPNNPFLTQVNINEYIDVPELLAQYPLCFTMPCNDKKQVIIVLFNPIPVADKNGIMQYPLHIFKAEKNVNK